MYVIIIIIISSLFQDLTDGFRIGPNMICSLFQDLIDGFDIGANAIRIGVQKYSSSTNTEFNLNTDYVKSSVKNRVANIYYTTGGTNTGELNTWLKP